MVAATSPAPDNEATLDRLEPTAKIVERLTGHRPRPATITRFHLRGSHGVLLRSTMIGHRRFSCERWVREWMDEITLRTTPTKATSKADIAAKRRAATTEMNKPARQTKNPHPLALATSTQLWTEKASSTTPTARKKPQSIEPDAMRLMSVANLKRTPTCLSV